MDRKFCAFLTFRNLLTPAAAPFPVESPLLLTRRFCIYTLQLSVLNENGCIRYLTDFTVKFLKIFKISDLHPNYGIINIYAKYGCVCLIERNHVMKSDTGRRMKKSLVKKLRDRSEKILRRRNLFCVHFS